MVLVIDVVVPSLVMVNIEKLAPQLMIFGKVAARSQSVVDSNLYIPRSDLTTYVSCLAISSIDVLRLLLVVTLGEGPGGMYVNFNSSTSPFGHISATFAWICLFNSLRPGPSSRDPTARIGSHEKGERIFKNS
jgi:hypothetical protein